MAAAEGNSSLTLADLGPRSADDRTLQAQFMEFGTLERTPAFRERVFTVSNPIEQKKNRYYDVLPHKETRVVLQPASADAPLESDYINASHVDRDFSGGIRHKCVCTQAPVPESMQDFWHMVWQERSTLILMLTPLRDKERVKATQYWPELGQAALELGPFSIECKRVDQPSALFSTRLFSLRNQAQPDKIREVLQLHCETWPDHGVPDMADWANMEFLFQQFRFYRSMQPHTHGTLVHCSAGIGRTGCFLAIDEFITQIEIEAASLAASSASGTLPPNWTSLIRINPHQKVFELRHKRPGMVQTFVQYKFIHQFLHHCVSQGKVIKLPQATAAASAQ